MDRSTTSSRTAPARRSTTPPRRRRSQAFGDHAERLAVSSNKTMVGHTLGAAGAMCALAAVLAIRDGVIPPTINYETADPDCDLDYVPNVARQARSAWRSPTASASAGRTRSPSSAATSSSPAPPRDRYRWYRCADIPVSDHTAPRSPDYSRHRSREASRGPTTRYLIAVVDISQPCALCDRPERYSSPDRRINEQWPRVRGRPGPSIR